MNGTTMQELETKRLEQKYFAIYHGFSHSKTMELSQELDELFNRYQRLK